MKEQITIKREDARRIADALLQGQGYVAIDHGHYSEKGDLEGYVLINNKITRKENTTDIEAQIHVPGALDDSDYMNMRLLCESLSRVRLCNYQIIYKYKADTKERALVLKLNVGIEFEEEKSVSLFEELELGL